MPRNIEIKARARNLQQQTETAYRVSDTPPKFIEQEDVFFHVPKGRLKLRILAATSGELILYHRPDQAAPKMSTYSIAPTNKPYQLKEVLESAYGIKAVIRKTRELCTVGRTRIHLDHVEGLGDFLELETVLADNEQPEQAEQEAKRLMCELGIKEADLIEGGYVDLLHGRALS